jgi:hypothetical protein
MKALLLNNRRGYLAIYSMVILVIIGYYASGIEFSALQQTYDQRFALKEMQKRYYEESALNLALALRVDPAAVPKNGDISYDLMATETWLADGQFVGSFPPGKNLFSTASISYFISAKMGEYAFASVTVALFHAEVHQPHGGNPGTLTHLVPLARREINCLLNVTSGTYQVFPIPRTIGTWTKTFSRPGQQSLVGAVEYCDGSIVNSGFVCGGNTDANATDALIWKRTWDGREEWAVQIGSDTASDTLCALAQTSDMGYLFAGSTNATNAFGLYSEGFVEGLGQQIWVGKLNKNGLLQWQSCVGTTTSAIDDFAVSLVNASESCYVFGNSGSETVILQIGSQGALLNATFTPSFAPLMTQTVLLSAQGTMQGGFLVSHYQRALKTEAGEIEPTSPTLFLLERRDENLGIIWSREYTTDPLAEIQASKTVQLPDGNYLVVGWASGTKNDLEMFGPSPMLPGPPMQLRGKKDFWVAKVASNSGDILWQACMGGTNDDEARDCLILPNSDFLILGRTRSGNHDVTPPSPSGSWEAWACRISSGGVFLAEMSLGGSSSDDFVTACQTWDQGLILLGSTASTNGNFGADADSTPDGRDFFANKRNTFP